MVKSRIAINAVIMDKRKAGIGNYAFHLLREISMLSHGLNIDIYIQQHMKPYFRDNDSMRFIPCPDFKSSRDRIFYEMFSLPQYYRENRYSLIHFVDYLSPIVPLKAKKVVTIHDLSYFVFPEFFTTGSRLMKQLLTGPGVRSAARVICVSDHTKRDVERLYQEHEKLRVIHLGVESGVFPRDEDREKEVLNKYGISGRYIMSAGTLEPRKNIAALVRAFRTAVEEADIPHSLVLCGKPGWKYDEIYKEINNSGLKSRIIVTGYVQEDELSVLFYNADAFIYPSLYEGFGLPPLEAMACGVPVICSSAASLPEVVGNAALTFAPKNEEMLASHIIHLIGDPDLQKELKQRGCIQASKFTWQETARKTISVYKELI